MILGLLVGFGPRVYSRFWLTLFVCVFAAGGVLSWARSQIRIGLHAGLHASFDGFSISSLGVMVLFDDSIPSQVGRKDVYIQIYHMSGVHQSIYRLTNVTGVDETRQVAVEDGSFVSPAGVQGGSS